MSSVVAVAFSLPTTTERDVLDLLWTKAQVAGRPDGTRGHRHDRPRHPRDRRRVHRAPGALRSEGHDLMKPTPRPDAGKPPSNCPACGRHTSDNFTLPGRAGLHCHDESTEKWAGHCGVVLCTCGIGYHARGHSKGPMQKVSKR